MANSCANDATPVPTSVPPKYVITPLNTMCRRVPNRHRSRHLRPRKLRIRRVFFQKCRFADVRVPNWPQLKYITRPVARLRSAHVAKGVSNSARLRHECSTPGRAEPWPRIRAGRIRFDERNQLSRWAAHPWNTHGVGCEKFKCLSRGI